MENSEKKANSATLISLFTEEERQSLIVKLEKINSRINLLHKYSSLAFLRLNAPLKNFYEQARNICDKATQAEGQTNKEVIAKISDRSAKCFGSISNIITSLQLHDIITQKLQHIQQIHEILLKEISDQDSQEISYLTILREISMLHISQLQFMTNEFEQVFNSLKKNLLNIWMDTTSITSLCASLVSFAKVNTALSQQRTALEKSSQELKAVIEEKNNILEFKKGVDEIIAELKSIPSVYPAVSYDYELKEDRLKLIEKLYTISSERTVYNKLFNNERGVFDTSSPANSAKSGGDQTSSVELF